MPSWHPQEEESCGTFPSVPSCKGIIPIQSKLDANGWSVINEENINYISCSDPTEAES